MLKNNYLDCYSSIAKISEKNVIRVVCIALLSRHFSHKHKCTILVFHLLKRDEPKTLRHS